MKCGLQAFIKLGILMVAFLATHTIKAQDCAAKLDGWNKKNPFPAGVVSEYEDCLKKVEAALRDNEIKIASLTKQSNAMITTLEISLDNLGKHYKSEDLDDKVDVCKKRKSELPKKHKLK